jgi:acetate kinase
VKVLVVNAGSVSLKVSLHDADADSARELGAWKTSLTADGYTEAFEKIADDIGSAALASAEAAGHRVVNGGKFMQPTRLDDRVRATVVEAEELAPLHNHAAIEALDAARARLPDLPMVAVFDTGFHATMPDVAARYALPDGLTERIRRYGYHGIAHQSMLEQYAARTGTQPGDCTIITLQLGGGCSACAIRNGRSIDTSMGFTPLEGLMMATRSGSLDPAVVTYLQRTSGMSPDDVDALLNERSGLLGVSGLSGDVPELLRAEAEGNESAALALEMFCYRVRQYIGAYLAVIEPQAIVFGGGTGEHAPEIRRRIIEPLRHLGLSVDAGANGRANGPAGRIDDGGGTQIWVVGTDEGAIIARETVRVLRQR